MYNPPDVHWDVLNDIMSQHYQHIQHIFGLKGLTTGQLQANVQRTEQFRDNDYSSLPKAPKDHQVQFRELPNRQDHDTPDKYPDGHTGISAYQVSKEPPNNGLWNAKQYHYTVMRNA